MRVGDNLSGLVWVMEWTSVLVIILRIHKKNNKIKNKKNSQTKYRKTKRESRATKVHITKYAVSLY